MKATVPPVLPLRWPGANSTSQSARPFNARAVNGSYVVRNIAGVTLATTNGECRLNVEESSPGLLATEPNSSSHFHSSAATLKADPALMITPCEGQTRPSAEDLDGKILEKAFWQRKPVNGRIVTSAEVLAQYRTDVTSLRAGFFLQNLFLSKTPCGHRFINPDQVIAEFKQNPDYKNQCLLAIARFKQICLQRRLCLAGKPVTPENVLTAFPNSPQGNLAMARFMADRCLNGQLLRGQPVMAETIVKLFEAAHATLDLTRFKANCFERGLPINGRQLDPNRIAADFLAIPALLELARFMEVCCLNGDKLNGQPVAVETVMNNYQAIGAKLELARFKQQCCLKKKTCHGARIAPEIIINDFPDNSFGHFGAARFKAKCCQRGLRLNGLHITPEAVVEDFQALGANLELGRFLEQCCLTGRQLYGQPTPAEMVIETLKNAGALPELAHFLEQCCLKGLYVRLDKEQPLTLVSADEAFKAFLNYQGNKKSLTYFKAECCIRGLLLNGQLVTPKMVLTSFDKAASVIGRAKFKANCCLKGFCLDNERITAESVISDFPPDLQGQLSLAHFKAQCCLQGQPQGERQITFEDTLATFPPDLKGQLARARFIAEACLMGIQVHGQSIAAETVWQELQPNQEGLVGIARFKTECCLKGLLLHGQQVTPEEVLIACQKADAPLELARFKENCCLKGLPINGRSITPEEVVHDYEQGGWKLERAIFIAHVAQHGLHLYGKSLDDEQVLSAYDGLLSDQSARKTEYLILRLNSLVRCQAPVQANLILHQAWQIINCSGIKDDHNRHLRCLLMILSFRFGLSAGTEQPSIEQIWTSINALRDCFSKTCLRFYFLIHCQGHDLYRQHVSEEQIISTLNELPNQLHYALTCWLDGRYYCPPYQNNRLIKLLIELPRPEGYARSNQSDFANPPVADNSSSTQPQQQWLSLTQPLLTMPDIGQPATTVLSLANEINNSNDYPTLLINGSFSRYLQGISPTFNDIDIIGTEESVKQLSDQLATMQINNDTGNSLNVRSIPGCRQLQLPDSICIIGTDTGHTTVAIQACMYSQLMVKDTLAVHLPGKDKPVMCLSFIRETALMCDTLSHLTESLDSLTTQLYDDISFIIPRTIIFNYPQTSEQRIFGLLMRYLMTLHKAKQFQSILVAGQANFYGEQSAVALEHLQTGIACLRVKLCGHSHYNRFVAGLEQRISVLQPKNDYLDKQRGFIKSLLDHLDEGCWP